LLQAIIRFLMSALSAFELANVSHDDSPPEKHDDSPPEKYGIHLWRNLKGVHPNDPKGTKSDLWSATFLGLLELLSYPVIMATGAWTIIGAWIGLKTLAQWKTWQENRFSYNQYLIGNALVVLLSLLCMVPLVISSAPACVP